MFQRQSNTVATKQKKPNKLVAGFAALSITAIVGAGGIAAAATPSQTGSGYDGNTSVVNLDLTLNNSNNNVFNIVLNIFR